MKANQVGFLGWGGRCNAGGRPTVVRMDFRAVDTLHQEAHARNRPHTHCSDRLARKIITTYASTPEQFRSGATLRRRSTNKNTTSSGALSQHFGDEYSHTCPATPPRIHVVAGNGSGVQVVHARYTNPSPSTPCKRCLKS